MNLPLLNRWQDDILKMSPSAQAQELQLLDQQVQLSTFSSSQDSGARLCSHFSIVRLALQWMQCVRLAVSGIYCRQEQYLGGPRFWHEAGEPPIHCLQGISIEIEQSDLQGSVLRS